MNAQQIIFIIQLPLSDPFLWNVSKKIVSGGGNINGSNEMFLNIFYGGPN